MGFKKTISATITATLILSQAAFAEEEKVTFKNERGSILELNILADNQIAGSFTTAVASKTCPDAVNSIRPITGYMLGNALTFTVAYPMCGSVLSFTGNFNDDKNLIDAISILNKQATDIIHEGPGARFIGHDAFKKIG